MNREEKIKEKRKPLVWICRNSGRYLCAVGLLAVVSAVISGSFPLQCQGYYNLQIIIPL